MPEIAGRWFRVSSDLQDEQNQEQGVDGYIARQGYETGRTYRAHDKSASKREHMPLLREALDDMRAGVISVLVIRNTDRIDRTEDLGQILAEVKDAGGRIESVTEPWLAEVSGLPGKLMTAVSEWTNAEYVRKLSVNVSDAQARRRAAGSWASSLAPFGYSIVGYHSDGSQHYEPGKCVLCYPDRGGRKTIEPNADAKTVERVFELTAEGLSYGQVCKALKAAGITSPGGIADWQEAVIGRIVRNPVFRGLVLYQGKPYMQVEPLVSSDLWLRANADIKTRSSSKGHEKREGRHQGRTNKGSGRPSPALLKPVCGRCGCALYIYGLSYRCNGKPGARQCAPIRSGETKAKKTDANTIKVAQLDAEVVAYFASSDEPEVKVSTTKGTDWAEEIAAVILARKDLDDFAADYDELYAEMTAELKRLRALPKVEPVVTEIRTGRSEGDVFEALDAEAQRAWLRANYVIRVYPEPILNGPRESRWEPEYIGPRLTETEASEILSGALKGLRA